ncbi:hypothetical protein DCO56_13640 [Sphingobacterium athyrii]|uniref:Uncharacterized protein n=2 Tax=Sphingobacterium athyrii TaxID=2152717 RepID=A0A363NU94_9SPHI|nr:hypothetical protein DCO56_13640 [Sphingobacterium athyrii]
MKTYEIKITANTAENDREIIEKYWELEDGKFVYRPAVLKAQYGLTLTQLGEIIAKNSFCQMSFGACSECGNDISKEMTAQSSFKKIAAQDINRCDHCERLYQERIEEEWEETHQALEKGLGGDLFDKKKLGRLKKLSPEELYVLKQIIFLRDKRLIFSELFTKNGFDETWSVVKTLVRRGLLEVKREGSKVVEFIPSEDIEFLQGQDSGNTSRRLKALVVDEAIDSYTFNLPVKRDPPSARSPKFSKVFTLPVDVNFEKGIEYAISGWMMDDGSINVSFIPTSRIFRSNDRPTTPEEDIFLSDFPMDRFEDRVTPSIPNQHTEIGEFPEDDES